MKTILKFILKTSWLLFFPVVLQAQPVMPFIVIDQFGYLPDSKKTAVIRNPVTGFDVAQSFPVPGATYQVVNAQTGQPVFTSSPVLYNNGTTDTQSGDKVWWFDFSSVTAPGKYYILDVENNKRSYSFAIKETAYNKALKHAVRMFFYQRAGCEKLAQYAGEGWADGASHVKAGQDLEARERTVTISGNIETKPDYDKDSGIAGTERDLHGGWYDAGDMNKYTHHMVGYIEDLLSIYLEKPDIWTDDYNIPESGNGIPDLLDEIKWGLDYFLRLQESDGSVISYVEVGHGCPPSSATGRSLYRLPSTHCTLGAVTPFALGAYVFGKFPQLADYAETLKTAALKAWTWANANQNVRSIPDWHEAWNSKGMNQRRMRAAAYLYQLTGDTQYRDIFENGYRSGNNRFDLFGNNSNSGSMNQYQFGQHFLLFYVLKIDGISTTVKDNIKAAFRNSFEASNGSYYSRIGRDGYRSYIPDYNWGSNQYKSAFGGTFYLYGEHSISNNSANNKTSMDAAADFLHYIHGVNPFGLVYVTNMNRYGATRSLTEIFHTWFMEDPSNRWNTVGVSTYGPAPGFLAGGANQYNNPVPDCCPNRCSFGNNRCPPVMHLKEQQPPAKCYADSNTGWPVEMWVMSEPSCGYQVQYIRLLSKFVDKADDNDEDDDNDTRIEVAENAKFRIFPNPTQGDKVMIEVFGLGKMKVSILDFSGKTIKTISLKNKGQTLIPVNINNLAKGVYLVTLQDDRGVYSEKLIIK